MIGSSVSFNKTVKAILFSLKVQLTKIRSQGLIHSYTNIHIVWVITAAFWTRLSFSMFLF